LIMSTPVGEPQWFPDQSQTIREGLERKCDAAG
jgi:hypothetical protein